MVYDRNIKVDHNNNENTMRYTNEKWFDSQVELVMHNIKASRNEDEKRHWIKEAMKKCFSEGMKKEIIIRALEQVK